MSQFAAALKSAKDALRFEKHACADHELTIHELEETIKKLEGSLQEKKDAEVGLRVRVCAISYSL